MTRLLSAVSAAALSLVIGAGSAAAQDFRALARQDLEAAHAALRDNHPAAVVQGEAGNAFRSWLDEGLRRALEMSAQVNSGDSHAALMRWYGAGFRDSNIRITPTFEGLGPYFATGWPGVATAWRDGRYVVSYVKPGTRGAPAVGSVVVECSGEPIEDYARRRLDLWRGDLDTEAGRIQSAPYLLWNLNNPITGGTPTTCKFQQGRRTRDVALTNLTPQAGELETAFRASVYVPPAANPLAVEQVNGRPWIHVHALADDAGWDAFYGQVEAQLSAIRGPAGAVIDLRGAQGLSLNATARGYGLANRIWTPEFTVSRQPPAGEITYRATPANREWYAQTLARMQADPRFVQESAPVIEETAAIVQAFDQAIAAGQASFTLPGRPAVADAGAANPVQGPIVVLVDSGCSGGCLDTVDLLVNLPNVRLAGSTTAVDSIFVEPSVLRLPSNYSDLSYGHKAWIARARGHNQPHTPEPGLTYAGDPTDEQAVRAWVGALFGG